MVYVHFLINKLNIEHIIALGGGTFGTESAVRKRGGSRNFPY